MGAVRPTLPEEKVRCDECGARPWVRCTTLAGSTRLPHAQREARYNGLAPCPQFGRYVRPSGGVVYDPDEVPKK
jgi:hypothetical protein